MGFLDEMISESFVGMQFGVSSTCMHWLTINDIWRLAFFATAQQARLV